MYVLLVEEIIANYLLYLKSIKTGLCKLAAVVHSGARKELTVFRRKGEAKPLACKPCRGLSDVFLDDDDDDGRFSSSKLFPMRERVSRFASRGNQSFLSGRLTGYMSAVEAKPFYFPLSGN